MIAGEEALKMLQPNPLTAPRAAAQAVITEGNLHARDGNVLEYDKIDDDRNQNQIHLPIADERFAPGAHALGRAGAGRRGA